MSKHHLIEVRAKTLKSPNYDVNVLISFDTKNTVTQAEMKTHYQSIMKIVANCHGGIEILSTRNRIIRVS